MTEAKIARVGTVTTCLPSIPDILQKFGDDDDDDDDEETWKEDK